MDDVGTGNRIFRGRILIRVVCSSAPVCSDSRQKSGEQIPIGDGEGYPRQLCVAVRDNKQRSYVPKPYVKRADYHYKGTGGWP